MFWRISAIVSACQTSTSRDAADDIYLLLVSQCREIPGPNHSGWRWASWETDSFFYGHRFTFWFFRWKRSLCLRGVGWILSLAGQRSSIGFFDWVRVICSFSLTGYRWFGWCESWDKWGTRGGSTAVRSFQFSEKINKIKIRVIRNDRVKLKAIYTG